MEEEESASPPFLYPLSSLHLRDIQPIHQPAVVVQPGQKDNAGMRGAEDEGPLAEKNKAP